MLLIPEKQPTSVHINVINAEVIVCMFIHISVTAFRLNQ